MSCRCTLLQRTTAEATSANTATRHLCLSLTDRRLECIQKEWHMAEPTSRCRCCSKLNSAVCTVSSILRHEANSFAKLLTLIKRPCFTVASGPLTNSLSFQLESSQTCTEQSIGVEELSWGSLPGDSIHSPPDQVLLELQEHRLIRRAWLEFGSSRPWTVTFRQ